MYVDFHLERDPTVRVNDLYKSINKNSYLSKTHTLKIILHHDTTSEGVTLFFRDLDAIQRFANNINSEIINLRAEAINQLSLDGSDTE